MSESPVARQPLQWAEQPVASAAQLAGRLGVPVWVPDQWPSKVEVPEILVMACPGEVNQDSYQLRCHDGDGRLLIIFGRRRQPGAKLEADLCPVEGERFETLTRRGDQPAHVVVRTPAFDVHISGSAVSHDTALIVARGIVEVAPTP